MLLYTTAFIAACNWATRHEVRSAERQEEQLQQEEIAAECSSLVCCELRKRNLVLFRLVDRVDHESPR